MKIPKAYPELTSRRVLVMEWIDGVRCTDLPALERFQVHSVPHHIVEIGRELQQQSHPTRCSSRTSS